MNWQRLPGGTGRAGRRVALGMILACAVAIAWPALPAHASCAFGVEDVVEDPVGLLEREPTMFVGTVTGVFGGTATVQVHEVWYGADLAPEVTVDTSVGDQGLLDMLLPGTSRSSVDPDVAVGDGWLFTPLDLDTFQIDDCTSGPATPDVLAFAPSDVRGPVAGGLSGVDSPVRMIAVVGLVLVALAVVPLVGTWVWWRRRR